jgi:MoaA/NifB/PqqE/SkfB family radical SAM enzyme
LSVEAFEELAGPFMNGNVEDKTCLSDRDECLSIEVTTHCNSSCSHCFAHRGISQRSSLPVDIVKEIIADGYNAAYRQLHITGGEPLLWNGLFTALDHAFRVGYKTVTMNTNGSLLTEEFLSRFAGYRGLSISVSLEGPKVLHERLRGKGTYKKTVLNIEKMLNAGIDLFIFTTVGKALLPALAPFADDLYKKFPGIKLLTLIQLIAVSHDSFALSEQLLDPNDFLQLVKAVSLINLYGHRTHVKNSPLAGLVSTLIDLPWIPRAHPLYWEGSMIIMANGNISLSHSSRDSFGKYKPGMIEKVLASREYRRAVALDITTCPLCKYHKLCMEYGIMRPSESHLNMNFEVPYCKRVLDMVAP